MLDAVLLIDDLMPPLTKPLVLCLALDVELLEDHLLVAQSLAILALDRQLYLILAPVNIPVV